MNIKTILSLSALTGALAVSNLAHADHVERRDRATVDPRRYGADVIATARLDDRRGEVTFQITPEMRRDGLQLRSNAQDLRIVSVELGYSDGRIEGLRGPELRTAMRSGQTVTIQRGRPPGLRFVRVRYRAPASGGSSTLELIQIHDGDGYTSRSDLRHDRNGWYEYDPRTYDQPRRERHHRNRR